MGRRERHLREIAGELGVELCLRRGGLRNESFASVEWGERKVVVWGWRARKLDYLIALHELAHFALGHFDAGLRSRGQRAAAEEAAWGWALAQSRERPGASMVAEIEEEMIGYYRRWAAASRRAR